MPFDRSEDCSGLAGPVNRSNRASETIILSFQRHVAHFCRAGFQFCQAPKRKLLLDLPQKPVGEAPEAKPDIAADVLAVPGGADARPVLPNSTLSLRTEKLATQSGRTPKDAWSVSVEQAEDSTGTSPSRRDGCSSRNPLFKFLAALGNRRIRIVENLPRHEIWKMRLEGAAFRCGIKIDGAGRLFRRGKHGAVLACVAHAMARIRSPKSARPQAGRARQRHPGLDPAHAGLRYAQSRLAESGQLVWTRAHIATATNIPYGGDASVPPRFEQACFLDFGG